MGRLVEGLWDCPYCSTTRIGGSQRECPNCGKARGEDTKFYMGTSEIHYVPDEKAASINRNPDWVCNYCNQLNSDDEEVCVSCGAPRTGDNLNYFEHHARREHEQITYTEEYSYDSASVITLDTSTYQRPDNSKRTKNTKSDYSRFDMPGTTTCHEVFSSLKDFFVSHWQTMLISLLVIIGIIGAVFLFLPKEKEITITGFSWERSIRIERYQTVEESDWSLPSGARLQYTREEFSHYQEVFDHYETKTRQVEKQRISHYESYVSDYRDLGNGYFEEVIDYRPVYETYYETETYQEAVYRSEPVYRTKYYYEIDKWLYERTVSTDGSDQSPYWGETNLSSDERASTHYETYTVTGIDQEEKEESVILSFEDWNSLQIGQTVKFKVSVGGYAEIIEIIE